MPLLDELLTAFVAQRRMKLPGTVYRPATGWWPDITRKARAPVNQFLRVRLTKP